MVFAGDVKMQLRWYPGARVERLRQSHSYGFVLALVLATFIWMAAPPDGPFARGILLVLEAATLVVAAWTSGLGRLAMFLSGGLVLVSIVIAAVAQAVSGNVTGLVYTAGAALVLASIGVIGVGVFDQRAVNQQSVLGAVSAYLLLGIFFTSVYGAIAGLGSAPFFAQGTDGTMSIRLYFSFITLTTVGYGDYTAASQLGRTMASLEALTGQLYLVTVVATLVSRMRPRSESA
jgi:hypothetical protein